MHIVARSIRSPWFYGRLHLYLLGPVTLSIFYQFSKMKCQDLSVGLMYPKRKKFENQLKSFCSIVDLFGDTR